MTVTWFSLAILATAIFIIGIEAWRGMKKGKFRALVTFGADILSVILGIASARLGASLMFWIMDEFIMVTDRNDSMQMLSISFAQMMVSALLFVVCFFIFRAVFRIVFGMITLRLRRSGHDGAERSISDVSRQSRGDKLKSACIGAVCGVIALSVVISPVMGTLKSVGSLINTVDAVSEDAWYSMRLKADEIHKIEKYSDDLFGNVFYCLGAGFMFRATASATVDGENISVPVEVRKVSENINALMTVMPIFERTGMVSGHDKSLMDGLCDKMDESWAMKYISAEIISKCSEAWLMGDDYLGIRAPQFNDYVDPVFKDVLRICQTTTAEHIADDMRSFFNVYTILANNGITYNAYYSPIQQLEDAGYLVEALEEEIIRNPRIAPIRNSMEMVAARMVAEQINDSMHDRSNYDALMENLATAVNLVKNDGSVSREAQVRRLAAYTDEYISDFGVHLSSDMSTITSSALLEAFGGHADNVEAEQIENYFMDLLK